MEFNRERLDKIILMGTQGYTFSEISSELGLLPITLQKMRKDNKELDEALNDWRFHYELYLQEKMEKLSSNLKSPIAKDLYKMIVEKHKGDSDNEIIIREI